MSYNDPNNIGAVVQRNYTVDIGRFLNQGKDIFQRSPGEYIGFFLISSIISSALSQIPLVGPIANIILTSLMTAGYFFVAFRNIKGGATEFGDFFKGFKNSYFLPVFLPTLIMAGITLAISLPAIVCWGLGFLKIINNAEASSGQVSGIPEIPIPDTFILPLLLVGFLLYLPVVYLTTTYSFAIPLVVDKRFEGWNALEASRQLLTKQWWPFFGFTIVLGLINIAGLLLCCVGLLVTGPFTYCALASAYAEIVGLNQETEL